MSLPRREPGRCEGAVVATDTCPDRRCGETLSLSKQRFFAEFILSLPSRTDVLAARTVSKGSE
jgi:hypothetical protein